jgi:hypothetical protein
MQTEAIPGALPMASGRLKAVFTQATIGFVILGIFGFILGAILGGAAQAEGKDITWVIGGVLGAIVCAITGAGCGVILALQDLAWVSIRRESKDASSRPPSPDGNNDPSTQS